MEEVDPAPRMQGDDGALGPATLEPRPTVGRPRSARHKGGDVLRVILDRGLGRRDGLDTLGLAFLDHTGDVLGDVLAQGENAAVPDWCIGPEKS